jgi:hypothetical protein
MKPQIKISIASAPLEQILTEEFEVEQRKLLALYHAAPELLDALKSLVSVMNNPNAAGTNVDGRWMGIPDWDVVEQAAAAIAKAEGK